MNISFDDDDLQNVAKVIDAEWDDSDDEVPLSIIKAREERKRTIRTSQVEYCMKNKQLFNEKAGANVPAT